MLLLLCFLATLILSWALTGLLLRVLSGGRQRATPGARGMPSQPTPSQLKPVGGGLAIIATLALTVPLWVSPLPYDVLVLIICAVGLSLFSALDHTRPLWPATRLAVRALAVALMLSLLPDTQRFVAAVPWWFERIALGLAWLWLINLTSVMDGIDGIAGAEAAAVALGSAAMLWWPLAQGPTREVIVALTLAAACLGYLVWNWAPARIFMGHAGSVPIGFLLGWLLLALAARGAWVAALALPMLFVADASITQLGRLAGRQKPLVRHRAHFYQRAVAGAASPPGVVGVMTLCNAVIVLVSVQSMQRPVASIAAVLAVTALFLVVLAHWAKAEKSNPSHNREANTL